MSGNGTTADAAGGAAAGREPATAEIEGWVVLLRDGARRDRLVSAMHNARAGLDAARRARADAEARGDVEAASEAKAKARYWRASLRGTKADALEALLAERAAREAGTPRRLPWRRLQGGR